MKPRYVPEITYIKKLWSYFDSWSQVPLPGYQRHALVCKTQALIYEDRMK